MTAGESTGPAAPTCPYCAIALERAPTRDRLCPSCRQPIVVRRVDGRIVLLTAEAAPIVDSQLQLEADERRWAAELALWLAHAARTKAPAEQLARLSAAKLTASVVDRSRALYLESAERAVRAARRNAEWSVVARIRRDEAATLYAEAGNPVPPPEDVVTLHREGMLAELRSIAAVTQFAELVDAGCCPACRTGHGTSVKITTELRTPRLPHEGCPKGICRCEWWISTAAPRRPRRRRSTSLSVATGARPGDEVDGVAPDPDLPGREAEGIARAAADVVADPPPARSPGGDREVRRPLRGIGDRGATPGQQPDGDMEP